MSKKISEYRKSDIIRKLKHTTTVTTPSGLECVIRPLSTLDLARMLKKSGKKSFEDLRKDPESVSLILDASVVDPPIVAVGKRDEDTSFLKDKIIEFSGLKPEEGGAFFSDTEFGKIIAMTAYTFHIRPADLLDPNDELPELTRLYFDFGCLKTVSEFIKDAKEKGKNYKDQLLTKIE